MFEKMDVFTDARYSIVSVVCQITHHTHIIYPGKDEKIDSLKVCLLTNSSIFFFSSSTNLKQNWGKIIFSIKNH